MTAIHVTVYRGAREPAPVAQDDFASWPELVAELTLMLRESALEKTALLALGPYRLREPHRSNANVSAITLLAIDVDHCNLAAMLAHVPLVGAALVYASPSDAPEARRVRVLAPCSREITPAECRATRIAFAEALGLGPGSGVEACVEPSRLFFIGNVAGRPPREIWQFDGAPVDVDALLLRPLEHAWGSAQAPAASAAPLPAHVGNLPPPDAGITAALGTWDAHEGRRWHLCGAVGGVMRKLGFTAARCEATIREWLADAPPSVDVAAGVKQALGAWRHPADAVSGEAHLAEVVGAEHAAAIMRACELARFPGRGAAIDPYHVPEAPLERLLFDENKKGEPYPTHANCGLVLASVFGPRIRYEEMRGRVVCAGIDPSLGRFPDGEWTDDHTTSFLHVCEGLGLRVKAAVADRAVSLHARGHAFNALRDWLFAAALAWDGTPRVDDALVTYWGAPDEPGSRVTSWVFLLSLAARGLEPGAKVDTCPILIGGQGIRKSSSLAALVGQEWFADSPLPLGDKDALQSIRGKWLWEFAENASVTRREVAAVNAFLGASWDTYRESYARHVIDVPRSCCFVASSNFDEGILRDPSGARRFLPVRVTRVDLEGIKRDREQILGEAAARVLRGEKWWPDAQEAPALEHMREVCAEHDAWDEVLGAWLEKRRVQNKGAFTLGDVFNAFGGALPMAPERVGRAEQTRAGVVLRRLGCVPSRGHAGKVRVTRYELPTDAAK